jgi:23S rRNA (cytidine1920-2'-O)/16S rRNA (cytidine1409-2'-O)-methyltransferase
MKIRLDELLVSRNLSESIEKARAVIMAGNVFIDGQREDKAGAVFKENVSVEVRGNSMAYVSRGGLKLEKAVKKFQICLKNKICMDVGCSTGGFTDCMLQNGAKKVYSVDVGNGQLAWKLRQDKRVVCMEKTNIRYVVPEQLEELLDFASIDVSFISLTKVLGPVRQLLLPEGEVVCLIKPQFEAKREEVGRKGVVREKDVHVNVIEKIDQFAGENGFSVLDLDFSPIKGPEGNIEYLMYLKKTDKEEGKTEKERKILIGETVNEAHGVLDKG